MPFKLISKIRKQLIEIPQHGLYLARPNQSHFEQWLSVRAESADFLRPWEPEWPADDLTRLGYKRRLAAYERHRQSGWGKTFFLFSETTDALLGGVSLTRITYGDQQSATLGYWMSKHYAGQGVMKKTVPAVLGFAFKTLGLQRVEAACLPTNLASMKVLESSGFHREGFAREYLEINGKREDHILFAILAASFYNAPNNHQI